MDRNRYVEAFALTLTIVAGAVSGAILGLAVGSVSAAIGMVHTLVQQLRSSWPWLRWKKVIRRGGLNVSNHEPPATNHESPDDVAVADRGLGIYDVKIPPGKFVSYPNGETN